MPTFITTQSGECSTCLYEWEDGAEVGYVGGELNCAGCYERAEDALSEPAES